MASDEVRKKWGTIFMGEREASVEQLNAMQEPLLKEKQQKEEARDYMERVRARAADRAREILGAAYAERQKVLDEAKGEAAMQKQLALRECEKLREEANALKQEAHNELARAQGEVEQAQKIREAAHDEGFQAGMDQASVELHEFRADLGQSLAALLHAIGRQRKAILEHWREELVGLVQCAAQAGSGYVLEKEHEAVLRALVFRALEQLENRSIVSIRVNPADEETVSGLFKAARERAPELKQWIVTGDSSIEPGGLVADSGSGSVDFQRQNFRQIVDGVLQHLSLPENIPADSDGVRELVEREVANIAAMTPEPDREEVEAALAGEDREPEPSIEEPVANVSTEEMEARGEGSVESSHKEPPPLSQDERAMLGGLAGEDSEIMEEETGADDMDGYAETAAAAMSDPSNFDDPVDPSLAELEDELFPLDGAEAQPAHRQGAPGQSVKDEADQAPDARTLSEGGFL